MWFFVLVVLSLLPAGHGGRRAETQASCSTWCSEDGGEAGSSDVLVPQALPRWWRRGWPRSSIAMLSSNHVRTLGNTRSSDLKRDCPHAHSNIWLEILSDFWKGDQFEICPFTKGDKSTCIICLYFYQFPSSGDPWLCQKPAHQHAGGYVIAKQ